MDHEDRKEVNEMLTDKLSGHLQKVEGQYRVIQAQLSSIEIQTIKTNSRVNKLEEKVEHIDKDLAEYRFFKKYPKVFIGMILVATLMAWYGFRQLNNKIEKQGVPVVTNSRGELMPLPDSTKILWLYNDSLMYIVKKTKK